MCWMFAGSRLLLPVFTNSVTLVPKPGRKEGHAVREPSLHQALVDRGLVTAGIHQGLICTPLNTHRYLVLPGLIGGSRRGVGDPDQQSHLHHGTVVLEMPRIPASPAGRPRPYRRPRGRRIGKGLPERGWWCCCGLCPSSTPGPPIPLAVATPWWGSRGRLHPWPGSWNWTRERGEGRRRERKGERTVKSGLADPGARHHLEPSVPKTFILVSSLQSIESQ